MRIWIAALVLAAAPAAAGPMDVAHAMREYYAILRGGGEGRMESIRDRLVANYSSCSPKTQKSVVNQIDRGMDAKYKRSDRFHALCAEILSKCGQRGINKLNSRFKSGSSKKRPKLRLAIVQALGSCGNDAALGTLLKMIHAHEPDVAAAAVSGCGNFASVKQKKRKAAFEKLLKRYGAVSGAIANKKPDSPEMKMYKAVVPAMNAAFKALSRGEEFDSFPSWEAWFKENRNQNWDKE